MTSITTATSFWGLSSRNSCQIPALLNSVGIVKCLFWRQQKAWDCGVVVLALAMTCRRQEIREALQPYAQVNESGLRAGSVRFRMRGDSGGRSNPYIANVTRKRWWGRPDEGEIDLLRTEEDKESFWKMQEIASYLTWSLALQMLRIIFLFAC